MKNMQKSNIVTTFAVYFYNAYNIIIWMGSGLHYSVFSHIVILYTYYNVYARESNKPPNQAVDGRPYGEVHYGTYVHILLNCIANFEK